MTLDYFIDKKEVVNANFGYSINKLNPIQQEHIFKCEHCQTMLFNGARFAFNQKCTRCDILPFYTCEDFKEL